MSKSISIVIPVYNGATTIRGTIQKIITFFSKKSSDSPYLSELILINDGSTDDTGKIIREISEKKAAGEIKIRYFSNSKNSGKGLSIKRGVKEANGDIIIFTDTDLPYGCSAILEMAEMLASGRAEIVIGDRTLAKNAYEKYGKSRYLTSRLFSLITRCIVPGFPDIFCGLKGFVSPAAKKIFDKIICKGFSFDVEMLAIAKNNNIEILRMPVIFQPLINPGSNNKSVFSPRKKMRVFCDLFIIWRRLRKGKLSLK